MLESIKTLLGNAAENDLPGLIESIIALLAVIISSIRVVGFTYSDHIDRILWNKKQQIAHWIYENVITITFITIAVIALVQTKQLHNVWLVANLVLGLFIIIWGIVFSSKTVKGIAWKILIAIILGGIGWYFNTDLPLATIFIFGFYFAWKSKVCFDEDRIVKKFRKLRWLYENIENIIMIYLFIFLSESCIILTPKVVDTLGSMGKIVGISAIVAMIYTIALNVVWDHKNCSKVYIKDIKDNEDLEGKWYIYFSIDSDTFLCGNSPKQHASNKFILVSKDKIINEKPIRTEK